MQVIGFTVPVGAGWYSEVKDKVSYQEFLEQCKFGGIGTSRASEEKGDAGQFFSFNDIEVVDYDDESGLMEFRFDHPKWYLEVHPLLRNKSKNESSIKLVLKDGN